MGKDLNLINKVWKAAQSYRNRAYGQPRSKDVDVPLDYFTTICVVAALLEDARLAQWLTDRTQESEEDASLT